MKNVHNNPALKYYYDNKDMVLAKRKLRYAISKWIDARTAYADYLSETEIEQNRKELMDKMFKDSCTQFETADGLRVRAAELLHQAKEKRKDVVFDAPPSPKKPKAKRSRHEKRLDYYKSKRAEFVAYSKAYTAAKKWVNENMPDAPETEKKKALREVTKTLIPQFYTEDIRPYNECQRPHKPVSRRSKKTATTAGTPKEAKAADAVAEVVPAANITIHGDVKIDPVINITLPEPVAHAQVSKCNESMGLWKDPAFMIFIGSIIMSASILIAGFLQYI